MSALKIESGAWHPDLLADLELLGPRPPFRAVLRIVDAWLDVQPVQEELRE